MLDKFRVKVTILATLIVTICCLILKLDFLKSGYSIIFTIIIFYFLSGIAEIELKSHIEKLKKEQEEDEKNNIQSEESNEEPNEEINKDMQTFETDDFETEKNQENI